MTRHVESRLSRLQRLEVARQINRKRYATPARYQESRHPPSLPAREQGQPDRTAGDFPIIKLPSWLGE